MPTKFASQVTSAIKAHAAEVAPQGLAAYAKFNGVMIGATKFGRRTQAYLNGMPCSFTELELLLCRLYREVFGNKPSEDAPALEMKSHPHTPTTRGQKDFGKDRPDAIVKTPTITTVQEFKTAPPGHYIVAGEAAGYMSRCAVMQILSAGIVASRKKHRQRVDSRRDEYTNNIFNELSYLARRYGCTVRISGAQVTVTDYPKRACVVKRIDKLAALYRQTYRTTLARRATKPEGKQV